MSNDQTYRALTLADYPLVSADVIRYADTDRQGHVNNAVFSTFLETGRTQFLVPPAGPLSLPDCTFVIANLNLDYLAEITWPGEVKIGTGVVKVGNTSMQFAQGIFQNAQQVAFARTVVVQVNGHTGRPVPLSHAAKETLAEAVI